MPTYVYRREDGSTFEIKQSYDDEPLTKDPESGKPVKRIIGKTLIQFKGKGFYVTDNAGSRKIV